MTPRAPGSLESLRRENRLRVLGLLQQRGHASQADIVRDTGLSRTTVSSLVAELVAEGIVVERSDWIRKAPSPNGGRPATSLTLDPSSGAFIGIDFGHDSVRAAVVNRSGELLAETRKEHDVDHQADAALDLGEAMVGRLLAQAAIPRQRVLGVGVAVSAPLRSGSVAFASHRIFPSWVDIDVTEALASRLGLTVHVGNDANLGALAEATFGAGRGAENILYLMLSAGIGVGLVLRGELYTGETGTAGELGHVVVDPAGQVCRCGNRGCLETVAGVPALTDALRYARGTSVTLSDLLQLVEAGDAGVLRLVGDAGHAIGGALAGMCSMLDPGLVIVGGELATTGDALLDPIRDSIDRETSRAAGHPYAVMAGALGPRAEVLGAAALAMDSESRQLLRPLGAPDSAARTTSKHQTAS